MDIEDKDIFFDYVDVNGARKKGEVLTLFTLDGRNNRYALCSVPNDEGTFDIMPFIVTSTSENSVRFDDIVDPEELAAVQAAATDIIS